MSRTLGYRWRLRLLMAEQGMFSTTELVPLLAERGITLSTVQVYRLVTQTPERLSLRTLMALCDILACTPSDLIEAAEQDLPKRKRVARAESSAPNEVLRPKRARIAPAAKD